jgi:hypothetical protein
MSLPLNEQAIRILEQESGKQDNGMSSYWNESFKDYEYSKQEFIGKSIPEGKGAKETLLISSMQEMNPPIVAQYFDLPQHETALLLPL